MARKKARVAPLDPFRRIGFFFFLTIFFAGLPDGYGQTLTDQLGRRVTAPDHPERIVALAPSITEIVFALGKGPVLKGVTRFSDYPEEARQLPLVGSYVQLDVEKIAALKPDLCIAVKDGNPKPAIDKLEAIGIPVFAVDPVDLETVMASVMEIGALLNAEEEARKIVNDMGARIGHVRERVDKAFHRPRIFFQIELSPIVSVGTQTFLHELIVRAGGINVAQGSVPYPRFSREQVISLAPEIIIITRMARGGEFEAEKKAWLKWPEIPAVKNNRILLVDSDILDRATPRLVEGFELLARLIHPELFPDAGKEKRE